MCDFKNIKFTEKMIKILLFKILVEFWITFGLQKLITIFLRNCPSSANDKYTTKKDKY